MLRTGWMLTTVPWCTCQKTSGSRRACKSFNRGGQQRFAVGGRDGNVLVVGLQAADLVGRDQAQVAALRHRQSAHGAAAGDCPGEAGLTTARQGRPAARQCGAWGAGWPHQPRCVQRLDEVVHPARPDQAFDRLRKRSRACAAQRRSKRNGRRAPPRIPATWARRALVPRRFRPRQRLVFSEQRAWHAGPSVCAQPRGRPHAVPAPAETRIVGLPSARC